MTLPKTKARQPKSAPDAMDSASAPDPDSAATTAAVTSSSPIDADIAASTLAPKKTKMAAPKPRLTITPATAVAHSGRRQPATTGSSAKTPPKQSSLPQKQLLPRIVQQPLPLQHQQPAGFAPPPPLGNNSECSLTRIIEMYGERTDILRLVLSAKSDEDKARAEYERRVQEELRYETRRLEFEMLLHTNYFKQQERDQQQSQLVMGPPPPPQHPHAAVLHSPLGLATVHHPASQQQHQSSSSGAHMAASHYGMQSVAHDPNGLRAYHHPDTPGGLDVRTNQHPFAFFKMPPGAPLHHPSAYSEQQHVPHSGNNINSGGSGSSQMSSSRSQLQLSGGSNGSGSKARQQQQQQHLGIRDRRPVPPAVSGLSVRILSHDHSLADAPRSAPVDGPDMKKRKISHDEVIMALRRKVMSKGGVGGTHALSMAQAGTAPKGHHPLQASAAAAAAQSTPRRSSLAVITHSSDGDDFCEEMGAAGMLSSSSSSSSSMSTPVESAASSPLLRVAAAGESQAQRVSSISRIVDAESTAAGGGSRSDVAA
ncbi:hypothetical protein IWW37_002571 [Coemansia sp. RSA 2050]|nr:hypothetical protein IWW37_002571 [Coemansia sp. RSA 2050]KAJ2732375.1 hypothetical protein IW152_003848 [Coemansia sp. BCRC 34962]